MDDRELSDRLQPACRNRDDPELAELSELLGFADGKKTTVNLLLLNELTGDPLLLAAIANDAAATADPDQALNNLERLSGSLPKEELMPVLRQPDERRQLLTILGASAFLSSILCRKNEYFHDLFVGGSLTAACDREEMLVQLRQKIPVGSDFAALQKGLREFKYHQVLRIGGRDLCGLADFQQTGAELSDLAAACLQRAFEICDMLLRDEYGAPLLETEDETCPLEAEFTILGMGKLGGRELNFSSDIDLIYFYSSERGRTAGHPDRPGGGRQISLHQYFCKLSEQIGRALGQVTGDGFVFRVDLNLRPEGSRGELATPLRGAEAYYESWGQSWERTALLKARPVAGSISLGERLLKSLEPFIYRRYLDYGMVEDMRGMKQRIDQSLARRQEADTNLKLGRGGIREIEFFIQALQVVHAGKNPRLRVRNSLDALDQLLAEGLIPERDHVALREAYIFLRNTEHRIQMVQEGQTHSLPSRPEELRALARRSGFADAAAFLTELQRHRDAVAELFHSLFYTSDEELGSGIRPEIGVLLDENTDPDFVKDLLEENGFRNPDGAFESLQILRHGPPHNPMAPRSRRQLEKLAPQLLQAVIDSPEPDMALGNLENFVVALRARATFFSLLAQNPEVITRLVNLFATSQFLSRIFIQSPQVLDSLVSHDAVRIKELDDFRRDLRVQLEMVDHYEDQLDALRRFRKEEMLRIALNDMHGLALQGQTARQLSELAEACLEAAVELARQELLPRFGLPFTGDGEPAGFVILGMGKLGGRELNYHSDLDLIFVYRGEGETRPVEGTDPGRFRVQSNREYFSRLAQRIISVLTLVTREGKVYEIDARLRPSGNQGPLVTSLDAFERYHQESAQLWERQALTKARAMAGPEDLVTELTRLVDNILYQQPLPENAAEEIRRLRQRMETEIAREDDAHFNIKTGRGGMVDVEFLTQYLQLKHGARHPELRSQNTLQTLQSLADLGLLTETENQLLSSGYKFLRRLENRLRLVHDQSINELSGDPAYLRKLARRLGYPEKPKKPEVTFLEDYRAVTGNIRTIFEHYLAG
ncbi:bifunctional [glutamate--ammonia ligase]-adenylyl-L-tyrosine phosphorylase/[glutamate--ammonia-ligase] adenylyltransferase [Geothermobacter hydrogeniphilus]|uniref:Glutamine-synthetase adenylyltransferase n=1 Tax=Geothermobacter hydrogeniphilus TaxID=1969733 RepID=A0A1X0Y010_9BACT|nr:bifunctional [glutamate--ammonia ligase]-adenylyl-L-tyrosine phosphorylase/[glutamate--ammonia-ligase] adenylyltransferase [Geothermobacter hydrogeniphilus]ORJ58551.1 glutamine-synthetase adenylyltransferase [Geothermobacter hydrogeniphilus]